MSTPKPPLRAAEESKGDLSGTLPTVIGPRTLEGEDSGDSVAVAESFPIPGPGSRVGRYLVLEEIGRGGMGVVLAAYDPRLDRKVAIKVIRTARDQERDRERVVREAQAMAQVRSPHVVAVHDAGELDERVFITMEFVAGTTLRSLLDDPPAPWREVVRMYVDAARGLQAAHEAGLVHRDFKPENVLVDESGRVAVSDFGLARLADDAKDQRNRSADPKLVSTLDTELTKTGELLGTPAYMAPEQWAGLPGDARSDQFSFCVALYRSLFRQPPFPGRTPTELMSAVTLKEPKPAPSDVVPRRVRRAIMRGLARAREDRYPTMAPLIAELEGALARRRRTSLAVGAAGLAVGVAALITERAESSAAVTCEDGADQIDRTWNARMAQVFGSLFVTEAERKWWKKTEGVIEDFVAEWKAVYVEACQLEAVTKEVVVSCLATRRSSLMGMLTSIDDLRAEAATFPMFTSALALPAECRPAGEVEASLSVRHASAAAGIPETLSAANQKYLAGHGEEALAMIDAIDWVGTGTEGSMSHGRALQLRFSVLTSLGRVEEGERSLRDGLPMAVRADDYDNAVQLAAILSELEAQKPDGLDRARLFVGLAQSWLPKATGRQWLSGIVAHARANILQLTGEWDEAARALDQAIEGLDPDNNWKMLRQLYSLRIVVEVAAGRPDTAADIAEQLIVEVSQRFEPDHVEMLEARAILARCLAHAGHPDRAATQLATLGPIQDSWRASLRFDALAAELLVARMRGDHARVVSTFERWIRPHAEVAPAVVWAWMAESQLALGDEEGAASSIAAAGEGLADVRGRPWWTAEVHRVHALLLAAQRRQDDARAKLEEARSVDPPLPAGHFVLRNLEEARATIESGAGSAVVGKDE